MLSVSSGSNPNYTAKIVVLKDVKKHPNADKLQIATVDFQPVIVGLDAQPGNIFVYFPVECQIDHKFISYINGYRDKTLNTDATQSGFFESSRRVRAVKLRGEYSMGFLHPIADFHKFAETLGFEPEHGSMSPGTVFDSIGDSIFVKKYVANERLPRPNRQGKSPRISRLVDGQVRLHVDTENLRRNAHKINPEDYIQVSYKTHGTSFWVANLLAKRKLGFFDKIARFLGVQVQDTEYDLLYGSRKVIKNQFETQNVNNFYDSDIWAEIKEEIGSLIPKGYTVYGEALGFLSSGGSIQGNYDYGCEKGQRKLQVYRITHTNVDGMVRELSSQQTKELCERLGLPYVTEFYFGKAKELFPELSASEHWNESFVQELSKKYTEKKCFMCKNDVPEEGIIVRKENTFEFEAYKLKSFAFLDMETAALDKGLENIEDQTELIT
jgi:RNA ligase